MFNKMTNAAGAGKKFLLSFYISHVFVLFLFFLMQCGFITLLEVHITWITWISQFLSLAPNPLSLAFTLHKQVIQVERRVLNVCLSVHLEPVMNLWPVQGVYLPLCSVHTAIVPTDPKKKKKINVVTLATKWVLEHLIDTPFKLAHFSCIFILYYTEWNGNFS